MWALMIHIQQRHVSQNYLKTHLEEKVALVTSSQSIFIADWQHGDVVQNKKLVSQNVKISLSK